MQYLLSGFDLLRVAMLHEITISIIHNVLTKSYECKKYDYDQWIGHRKINSKRNNIRFRYSIPFSAVLENAIVYIFLIIGKIRKERC